MNKMKLAVIFGGMSSEHDVSIVSGMSILKNLNKEKYDITPIYIDKDGNWFKYTKNLENIVIPKVGDQISDKEQIENIIEILKKADCIFPVLHGLYGEDGTIQGLFELLKIPYVGCKVLASSISMDKAYTKMIFEKAGLNQANYQYIRAYEDKYIFVENNFDEIVYDIDQVVDRIEKEQKQKYPLFVKPANSGSSVGIKKADNKEELKEAIEYAAGFDRKILIEEGIVGREVECAVLGNEDVIASCVGEILAAEEFYTYDSKYNNNTPQTVIPAEMDERISEEIRRLAIKAFKSVNGSGLSRVDFFVEGGSNKIIINEINTLPGFTTISMYPKLFEAVGISYSNLLDELIDLAIDNK